MESGMTRAATVPARRRARPDQAESLKRGRILDAAESLFLRQGVSRTVMSDVARAANVAKGTLYLYYDGKEALFRALAERLCNDVRSKIAAALLGPGPADERIAAALDAKIGRIARLTRATPYAAELTTARSGGAGPFQALAADLRKAVGKVLRAEGAGAQYADLFLAAAYGELAVGDQDESAVRVRLRSHAGALLRGLKDRRDG
jgi:AcrR family transcriptional regulator